MFSFTYNENKKRLYSLLCYNMESGVRKVVGSQEVTGNRNSEAPAHSGSCL